jgi:hypothetical protein
MLLIEGKAMGRGCGETGLVLIGRCRDEREHQRRDAEGRYLINLNRRTGSKKESSQSLPPLKLMEILSGLEKFVFV